MSVAPGRHAQALADLASALTAAATQIPTVLDTATRAAAELVGDCAAIRLGPRDGGESPLTAYHPDPDRTALLARILEALLDRADDEYAAAVREGGAPVLLPSRAWDQTEPAGPVPIDHRVGVHAGLLCPLAADETQLGYLLLIRTDAASSYSGADINLARDIAARVSLALATARSVDRVRASEERYRRIVETTLDGVWQLDPDGVTTFVNERMASILGLPRADLLGLSVRGFLDDTGQTRLAERLDQRRRGEGEVYECRLIRATGSSLWVQISAAALVDEAGRPAGSLNMVTDITDRVAARDTRRQLDQLRRMDSLGQLAGGIAHDFNNLLTVIAGSAEILAGTAEPDSPNHQLATRIVQAAASGAALTHQLLSFGRRSQHAHAVPVPELLEGVGDLLRRALGEHIRLNVITEPGLWPVHADRGELEQVLINLAANARDAMGRGGVLTIEAANTDIEPGELDNPSLSGRFVRLAVSDTGSGMTRDTRQHAFEPFFTTKGAHGAAGLGLTTVHAIVATSGGHLHLYTEPGIGTTVKLFLPAEPTPGGLVAPAEEAARAPARGNVLVVEDQPELAQLVRYLLAPAGYTVTVATDPAAAIVHVHTGLRPDLLLTDVVMPGMTGPELARALRTRNPSLRVLYMSGYTTGVLNPRGHLDEDSELLPKPFNRQTLLAAVAKALAH
jgi:two-component system, cell cycle sensor histidine kinase and response regulator CckA